MSNSGSSAPHGATNGNGGTQKRSLLFGRRLLAGSLVLNAFLAALVIGPLIAGANETAGVENGRAGNPEEIRSQRELDIPTEERRVRRRGGGPPELRAMREVVGESDEQLQNLALELERAVRVEIRATRERIDAARLELAEAARSEPFDPARFDIALADLRAAQAHRFTLADRGLRELMGQADADTRVRFADELEAQMARRAERRAERRRLREQERALSE